jgi:hypothetical protein
MGPRVRTLLLRKVFARKDRHERQARRLERLAGPFEPIDERHDAHDDVAREA